MAIHHPFSSLSCTLPFTQFATHSSLSFKRAVAAVCVYSKLPGGKLPALQKNLRKENTWQDAGLNTARPPQPRCGIPSKTPPTHRIGAGRHTTAGSARNSGGGGCGWRPGGCSLSSVSRCPANSIAGVPGPGHRALPGRERRRPRAPRPTRAGGGRQPLLSALCSPLPAHRARAGPGRTHPGFLQPRGPAGAPSSAAGETMGAMTSPSSNARTPPTSPRSAGRSRPLSPPGWGWGWGSRPEAAPARRFRSTPHPPPR